MASSTINSYVEGNRVKVTATTKTLPDNTLTTPDTWTLQVRNMADGSLLTFDSVGPTLPAGVNASMDNPSAGLIEFYFDVDAYGERRLLFKGTGACKCAAKGRFVVEKGDI
jgi:hypothetical protein